MNLLVSVCNYPWWLWFILPFLFGLILGWLIWGHLKSKVEELGQEQSKYKQQIKALGTQLEAGEATQAHLKSEIALLEGRLKEATKAKEVADADTPRLLDTPPVLLVEDTNEASSNVQEGILPEVIFEEVQAIPGPETALHEVPSKSTKKDGDPSTVPSLTDQNVFQPDPGAIIKPRFDKYDVLREDDLQIVEGIGPKMSEVLHDAGIKTWHDLSTRSTADLRSILDAANAKRYRIIDPSTWPDQAGLALEGKWDDLIKLQKNLDSGRPQGAQGETDSKVEKLLIKLGVLKRWKQDDLTAIEGIGPKIATLLKNADILTWRQLSNTPAQHVQDILNNAGKRYQLADPSTWAKQAEMAADGRWDDLEEYQQFLKGGK